MSRRLRRWIARRLSRGPRCALEPRLFRSRFKLDHPCVFRLVVVEVGERTPRQRETCGLDGVLVRDNDERAPCGQPVTSDGVGGSCCECSQRFWCERQVLGIGEVGSEFAGEDLIE